MKPPGIKLGAMNHGESALPFKTVQTTGKFWKGVAYKLAEGLQDVSGHAKIHLQPRGKLVNNLGVVSNSRHADVVPGAGSRGRLSGGNPIPRIFPAGAAQGDTAGRPTPEIASGADGMERETQLVCHNVRRAAGENSEGHMTPCQTINDFVNGPIPATDQDNIYAARHGGLSQFVRHGGPRRGRQLDFQP
jgi:hypothetical protein